MLENIQGLSSENKFEREFFLLAFNSGNVIFLWSGFDEISPSYFDKISSLIVYVREQAKNTQIICTQTPFEYLSSEDQHNIKMSTVLYKGISVRFTDLFIENPDAYKVLKPSDISDILNNEEINISSSNYKYLDEQVILKWKNLDQNLKRKVLGSIFKYQGLNYPFKNIDELYPKILTLLTSTQINLVLNNEILKIGNDLYDLTNKYQKPKQSAKIDAKNENKRDFCFKNSILNKLQKIKKDDKQYEYKHHLIENDLFNNSLAENMNRNYKLFVLPLETKDEQNFGFNKNAIQNLKTQFSKGWVSYINLEKFSNNQIENFFKGKTTTNPISILEGILNLSGKNTLESGLFEASYNSGIVILFWDGFENVNENNFDRLFELIKVINKDSGNFQFVASCKGAAAGRKDAVLSIYTTLVISALLIFSKKLLIA